MNAALKVKMPAMSIEDCQSLNSNLRKDLEVLDYETRARVIRMRAETRRRGNDDAAFLKASSTVLLSIAADLLAHAAEDSLAAFDASSFEKCAGAAARWAEKRRPRSCVAAEAEL
jgi:hypothetical protein